MVTTLSIERSTTLTWGTRTVFAAAVLMTLSAFAKETATAAIDLPNTAAPHAPVSIETHTAAATVRIPAVKAVTRTLATPLKALKTGMASWYGKVLENRLTASGRRFHMVEMTAAHRTLPFGSQVKVTDLRNRKSVVVTITDRGDLPPGRVIDLSYGAAEQLDMLKSGVDPVRLEVLTASQVQAASPLQTAQAAGQTR